MGPGLVASRTWVHGRAGCGGRQRSSPAVEAAYGITWNRRWSSVTVPRTGPASVCTTAGSAIGHRGRSDDAIPQVVLVQFDGVLTKTALATRLVGLVGGERRGSPGRPG